MCSVGHERKIVDMLPTHYSKSDLDSLDVRSLVERPYEHEIVPRIYFVTV